MTPVTKTKSRLLGDVSRVFDILRLASDEERQAMRALGTLGDQPARRVMFVTRLSNGSDPAPHVED
jgi:hypothetical protein